MLAINRAYDQNGPAASRYRDYLEGQGYDTARHDAAHPRAPAHHAARPCGAGPLRTGGQRLAGDDGVGDGARRGRCGPDVATTRWRATRAAMSGRRRTGRSSRASCATRRRRASKAASPGPDGSLSLDGQRRVQHAMLHAAYGDPALVSSIAETGDDAMRAFGGVLQDSAGRVAQLRRSIAAGHVDPAADLSGPMVEAARVVQRARSDGAAHRRRGGAAGRLLADLGQRAASSPPCLRRGLGGTHLALQDDGTARVGPVRPRAADDRGAAVRRADDGGTGS